MLSYLELWLLYREKMKSSNVFKMCVCVYVGHERNERAKWKIKTIDISTDLVQL